MWKLFKDWAYGFIQEHSKAFWPGVVAGGIGVGNWAFATPDLLNVFWIGFFQKLFATVCGAALGGLATSLVQDLYRYKVKPLIFKRKNKKIKEDEQPKQDRA